MIYIAICVFYLLLGSLSQAHKKVLDLSHQLGPEHLLGHHSIHGHMEKDWMVSKCSKVSFDPCTGKMVKSTILTN